jgi:acyl-CoA synthetase (AMP-forming)/AMP-acid ligase II
VYPAVHARATPDKPAVVMAGSGRTLGYRELDEGSNRCARLLRELGLRRGDGIAIHLENHPRFFEICWAAQRSGLYYTAISTKLTTPEIEYIVADSGARALFSSAALAAVSAPLAGAPAAPPARFMLDGAAPGFESYEAAVASRAATPIDGEEEGQDMLYSSGTTGRPKGIRPKLSGRDAGTPPPLVTLLTKLYAMGPDTVYLSPAPLYHAAPLRFNLTVQRLGGTCIVMEHFEPREALRLIERHRVTHSQWVPTHFVRLLRLTDAERAAHDLSSLRFAIHAAAPCPIPVKERMLEWWGPVLHEY